MLAKAATRVGEEHHPKARDGEVTAGGIEGVVLGVGLDEADVVEAELAAAFLGAGEQRRGDVEAEDLAGWRRPPRRAGRWSRRRRSRCRSRARPAGGGGGKQRSVTSVQLGVERGWK